MGRRQEFRCGSSGTLKRALRDSQPVRDRLLALRIGFVTTYDAELKTKWSGIPAYMLAEFKRQGIPIEPINVGGMNVSDRLAARLVGRVAIDRGHRLAERRARRINTRADLLLSPGTVAAAGYRGDRPLVTWTDATFASMLDFYPGFSRLSERAIRIGNAQEQRAIDMAATSIYSSDWAAASAVRDYGADPTRVHVIPFGANLDEPPTLEETRSLIEARTTDRCELLFAGVEWDRKGGEIAIEAASLVEASGIPVRLTLLGCEPQGAVPPFVEVLGFLDKTYDAGAIRQMFERSHYLILPTRAECSAIVLNEASAFGTPSLTTNVGGNSTAIKEGVNGHLLELADGPAAYAARIIEDFRNYGSLANTTAARYHEHLSWEVAVARAVAVMESLVT
jgi:glycosyltransferase involved in cell wall biosynthesis